MTSIAVSVGSDYNRARVDQREFADFEALTQFIRERQPEGGFTGPYLCAPMLNGHRKADEAQPTSLVIPDFDSLPPGAPRKLCEAIAEAGWRAALWTTRKSTPEAPRVRLVCELDRPVTKPEYAKVYRSVVRQLAEATGLPLVGDPNCEKPEQPAVLPQPTSKLWTQTEGTPVNVDSCLGFDPDDDEHVPEAERKPDTGPGPVRGGGRNTWLTSEAGRLRNLIDDPDEGLDALLARNDSLREHPKGPLDCSEVVKIRDSVWRYERDFNLTDQGNAERFVHEHGDEIRHVHEFSRWIVWAGHYWREDCQREVELLCKRMIRNMQRKAVLLDDDDKKKQQKKRKLLNWALTSESAGRIAAAVQLARSEPGITITAARLDADPWALVTTNTVLDLRTGLPVTPRRDTLLTKQAGTSYDPAATCPTWDAFLDRVMRGDAATINFLQRAVGYSLTGLTTEHCVFFLYGTGANGKTTFVNTIRALLGEYARATDTSMWMSKKHTSVPDDLAALRGVRLATTVEGEDGQRLAESRIKQIAGGDAIGARKLYGEWFEFVPQLKLFFATNHKPQIQSDDYAIWRRIRLIPFDVQIPEGERDTSLPQKLLAELPGILNWALEGCRQWQADGLTPPTTVRAAVDQYRAEQDRIGAFLEECCVANREKTAVKVTASDLYREYARWCESSGCYRLSAPRFKEKLRERRYEQKRTKEGLLWHGIGLLAPPEDEM